MRATAILLPLLLTLPVLAQRGDRPGEKQRMLPDSVDVPPATVRTPAEELATLQLPEGFEARLFAAEPMVMDPVVATWDAAGRMWVCEFTSYMKDIVATDESEPTGRIVVLHDDDGDGAADRSTVFADGLVLPRAVLPMVGGALVIEPPKLLWMPDADGDLVADGDKVEIMGGFEAGTGNPEHSGNGLTFGFDHRIHLCNDRRMLRPLGGGRFEIENGSGGGQWGLCLDDRGRLYSNNNSDWLRCDLVPRRYGPAADRTGRLPLLGHRVVKNQSVWPARMTPGINRGYQGHMLRDDYTLARTTGVCSPLVYRGSLLPFDGDVFVCEPCGNCVRRIVLSEQDGVMHGDNPYEAEQREFLASTDERFRPVHLQNGPDGALYVIDMYRGVIQHRNYVTSFLRHQVEKRGLQDPIHKGRIWRIVPKGHGKPAAMPKLSGAAPAAVAAALSHPSGTVRDLALQQLAQRKLGGAAAAVRGLLAAAPTRTRIAAMSALVGLGVWNTTDVRRSVRDADPAAQAFAWQHAGEALASGDPHVWGAIDRIDAATAATTRWHAALAIGDAFAADEPMRAATEQRALDRLARFVLEAPDDGRIRAVVAAAAHPRVLDVVRRLPTAAGDGLDESQRLRLRGAVVDLGRRAMSSRDVDVQRALLAFAGDPACAWRTEILAGAVKALPKGGRRVGWLVLGEVPPVLAALAAAPDEKVRKAAQELLGAVRVDGQALPGVVTDLSDAEKQRVEKGAVLFRGVCASCHQLDGRGQRGLAPPLADSDWVTGSPERLIRIALHGVRGPIEVDGETWELEMPGQAHLNDVEMAQVLSYLRRAFGHQASCVTKKQVATERKRNRKRASAWTAGELLGND